MPCTPHFYQSRLHKAPPLKEWWERKDIQAIAQYKEELIFTSKSGTVTCINLLIRKKFDLLPIERIKGLQNKSAHYLY